jgi:endonuclease/exonuclease/phosphatase family metal-dependent hydrolase
MDTLRICTWNIKQGHYLKALLREISENKDFKGLDFMAIQESMVHKGIDDAQKIAEKLGPEYRYFQGNVKVQLGRLQGNALIWNEKRIKIDRMESFYLPDVKGSHLPRWEKVLFKFLPKQDRICLVLGGTFMGKKIKIYVTHLEVLGFIHKRAQLDAILDHDDAEEPADICCIAGDFNTYKIISRPRWRSLAEAAKESGFHDLTTEIIWTFARKRVRIKQKLDSIFVKPYHFAYKSWSLDIKGSDHIPIFSDIKLNLKKRSKKSGT